jgi:hypothetical protein
MNDASSGDVFRARLILALADGQSYSRIEDQLGIRPTIARWKEQFETDGMAGLEPRHKGSQPTDSDAGYAGANPAQDDSEATRREHALVLSPNGGSCGVENIRT